MLHIGHEHRSEKETNEDADHFHSSIDPHFWTDPLIVKSILPLLTDSLCNLDVIHCNGYRQNLSSFIELLDSLTNEIEEMLRPVKNSPILLSHPFFQYYFKPFN